VAGNRQVALSGPASSDHPLVWASDAPVSEVVHGEEPPLLVPASAGGLQIVVTPMIDNNGIPGSTPHVV
jgi:hypothetical protein